jgi:hypothetical protein
MKTLRLLWIVALSLGAAVSQAADNPFTRGAAEANTKGGIVVIPAHPEFYAKSPTDKIYTLSTIWKLIEAKGGAVRRLDVVKVGQTKVDFQFTRSGGLVNVRP